jgi:hypothetical protein
MSLSAVEIILRECDCPTVEKMVLMAIASHGKGTDGNESRPSVRRVAKMAGISTSTVHYALDSLRAKGWLSWDSGNFGKKTANIYTIHLDAISRINWTLYRTSGVSLTESLTANPVSRSPRHPVSRFGLPSVSLAGHEASTEAGGEESAAYTERKTRHAKRDPRGVALRKKKPSKAAAGIEPKAGALAPESRCKPHPEFARILAAKGGTA